MYQVFYIMSLLSESTKTFGKVREDHKIWHYKNIKFHKSIKEKMPFVLLRNFQHKTQNLKPLWTSPHCTMLLHEKLVMRDPFAIAAAFQSVIAK